MNSNPNPSNSTGLDHLAASYNEIPYPTAPQSQTHPERLAVLAQLFGLETPAVENARVLEIGCGDGSNLIPMAAVLPGARFLGIDLSTAAIEKAQSFASQCGLSNIHFATADIASPLAFTGQFDFIICHGVFSWCPAHVRHAILEACSERLSPHGLAMISYNTLPGWNFRLSVRQVLLWHLREINEPLERLDEASAFAKFLSEHSSQPNLRAEFAGALEKNPHILFHDELSPENQPFYFHEFIHAAAAHNLQYVAEPDLFEFIAKSLTSDAAKLLDQVADGRLEREQYLDFLVNRRFRQTILTHANRQLFEKPDPSRLAGAFFAANEDVEVRETGDTVEFTRPSGPRLQTNFRPGIETLKQLLRERPKRLRVDSDPDLLRFLFEAASGKFVTFHSVAPAFVLAPGPLPVAFAPARVQAALPGPLANVHHRCFDPTEGWVRELISKCDGRRPLSDLLPNVPETDATKILARLARMALFVA